MSEDVFNTVYQSRRQHKSASPTKSRTLFSGKVKCGCCGKSLQLAHTQVAERYYFCESVRFVSDVECFEGRLLLSDLSAMVLAAIKVEAQKAIDLSKMRKSQRQTSPSRTAIVAELKKQSVKMTKLKQQGVLMFEDFADGKITKETYATATTANSEEMNSIQSIIEKLNKQLDSFALAESIEPNVEPILKQVINAETVSSEIVSLIKRVTVFEADRIEIQFAFGDVAV